MRTGGDVSLCGFVALGRRTSSLPRLLLIHSLLASVHQFMGLRMPIWCWHLLQTDRIFLLAYCVVIFKNSPVDSKGPFPARSAGRFCTFDVVYSNTCCCRFDSENVKSCYRWQCVRPHRINQTLVYFLLARSSPTMPGLCLNDPGV